MTENQLITNELDLPISNIPESKLAKLSERAFLSFIKICSTDMDIAKFKEPGAWLLCKDATNKQNITNSIEVMVTAARPLACHTTNVGTERYYDMDSAEYQAVEKASQLPNHTGDWHGTEFLIWLRAQRIWATWHASSETNRQRAEVLTGILTQWALDRKNKKLAIDKAKDDPTALAAAQAIVVPNPQAKLGTELVFYKRYNSHKWAVQISPVTTPFSEVPPFEDIRDRGQKFLAHPVNEKETLDVAGADAPAPTRG